MTTGRINQVAKPSITLEWSEPHPECLTGWFMSNTHFRVRISKFLPFECLAHGLPQRVRSKAQFRSRLLSASCHRVAHTLFVDIRLLHFQGHHMNQCSRVPSSIKSHTQCAWLRFQKHSCQRFNDPGFLRESCQRPNRIAYRVVIQSSTKNFRYPSIYWISVQSLSLELWLTSFSSYTHANHCSRESHVPKSDREQNSTRDWQNIHAWNCSRVKLFRVCSTVALGWRITEAKLLLPSLQLVIRPSNFHTEFELGDIRVSSKCPLAHYPPADWQRAIGPG